MADTGISTKQAALYLGITFACFAVLYPSLFHPVLKSFFNFGNQRNESATNPSQEGPEKPKHTPEPRPGRPPIKNVPSSPHAESQRSTVGQTQPSGKGGLVGFVLPVYAVGIVIYLVYVVSKVYSGGGKKSTKKLEETDVYETLQKRLSAIDFERVLQGDDQSAMEELTTLAEQLKKYRGETDVIEEVANDNGHGRQQSDECSERSDHELPTAEECSLDDLLEKTERLNSMTADEAEKLQRKLLEAEAKMARIASAFRKASAHTEQLANSLNVRTPLQSLVSTKDNMTADEDVDSARTSVTLENTVQSTPAPDELEKIETLGTVFEERDCVGSAGIVRKRIVITDKDFDN